MLNTRMTIVVALAAVVVVGGAGVTWYLQPSSQVDIAIQSKPATASEVAPKTVLEPAPSASPQGVADVIDGYDDMSPGDKQKAVFEELGKVKDLATDRLLKTELAKLMSGGAAKHANQKFEGVVPNGWAADSQ